MTPRGQLLTLLLLGCLVSRGLGISLPSFFGGASKTEAENSSTTTTTTTTDAATEEVAKDDAPSESQDKRPTTYRPPLLHIPHPADSPLNPAINPHHPFHPDNRPHFPSLPPLPHLPGLPHFTRETIRATKTVFVEVTDRVTVHPVCMTTHKVTPPCLPYNPHHHHGHYHREGEVQPPQPAEAEEGAPSAVPVDLPLIQPTKAAHLIEPTAAPHLLEPTRILGGVSLSEESIPGEVEGVEVGKDASPAEAREGRYVEITPLFDAEEEVQIKDEPEEEPSYSPLNMVQNLLHRSPVTHFKTKTLWVTKVEKVLDTRVTATLLAKNCIPTNSHIPLCAPHGGLFAPGYHGYLGEGTFSESFGGNFVAGSYTEKDQEQDAKVQVHEQRAEEQIEYEEDEAVPDKDKVENGEEEGDESVIINA